jgi:SAM-dependent methyltransferase
MDIDGVISLRCVECHSSLLDGNDQRVHCQNCLTVYPVVSGIPVLLKQHAGLFSAETAGDNRKNGFTSRFRRFAAQVAPSLTRTALASDAKRRAVISSGGHDRSCLVIGAGDNMRENETLKEAFGSVVTTDVSVNTGVRLICDGHELPFVDDQFDFVMLTAVLEHVLDPERVVTEISRVLRLGGTVYAVTPFMQQVHMGAFDFQRFTDLGHRWLFRGFAESERGTCGGPASSLLWSLCYFSGSFGWSRNSSLVFSMFPRALFFWLKYLDAFLEKMPASRDSANGFYFVGINAKRQVLSEAELIHEYAGTNR